MSSTFVADTTDDSSSAGNTVIIIVNDDTGNISVDQETLQLLSKLGAFWRENPILTIFLLFSASQENTTLSVVRVNEAAGDNSTDVNMTVEEIYNPVTSSILKGNQEEEMEAEDQEVAQVNGNAKVVAKTAEPVLETTDPLMDLDQEEILKIEHALQAEAGQFFNNSLPLEAGLDDLLDPELTGGYINTMLHLVQDYVIPFLMLLQILTTARLLQPLHSIIAIQRCTVQQRAGTPGMRIVQ